MLSRSEPITSKIDLTSTWNSDSRPTTRTSKWVQVRDVSLSVADRHIILHPTAWMHDLIISAGQNVLKKETIIKGFQHPCLGQRCAFNVQNGDFIQVLNNASCHWLTISTIGASCGEVFVYDSLYSGAGSSLKDQISSILHTRNYFRVSTCSMFNNSLVYVIMDYLSWHLLPV